MKINMYKFDSEHHLHTLDGKPLHGVTTVLSVISKPQLIPWAAGMAVDYIQSEFPKIAYKQHEDGFDGTFSLICKEARVAHRKKKEAGGDWGKSVHEAIEAWIKEGKEPTLQDTQLLAFNNFRQWFTQNNVQVIESEKHLHSEELWLGGICDLIFSMNGKKYIGDIKTSSAIYPENFLQMAAYALMAEEQGITVDGYMVINLKKNGEIETKLIEDMETYKQGFKYALGLYKTLQAINKLTY